MSSSPAMTRFQRTGWVSGSYPIVDIASLPFFWKDALEYTLAMQDPRMVEIMDRHFAEAGLVKMGEFAAGNIDAIFANQPIATVEDWAGLKTRTTGVLPTLTVKELGGAPLSMATTEMADALQKGTVDAIQTSRYYGLFLGLADVSTDVSFWAVQSAFPGAVIINQEAWDSLPADLQEIMLELGREMSREVNMAEEAMSKYSGTAIGMVGLTTTQPDEAELDKARQLAKPAIAKWLELAGPDGPAVLAIAAEYASGAAVMLAP